MRIRQAKLGFNSQWENSFLRNVNLIRDSKVTPDKVKEKRVGHIILLSYSCYTILYVTGVQ